MPSIAISNLPTLYAEGLATSLREVGFEVIVERADLDILDQASNHSGPLVILLGVQGNEDLELLSHLARQLPTVPIVTVSSKDEIHNHAEAIRAGATANVAQSYGAALVADTLRAALAGQTILPSAHAQTLAHLVPRRVPLDEEAASWLSELASGATVVELAHAHYVSTREMHRRLNALYERMGASCRSQALVIAARWGVVYPTGPDR